MLVSFSEDNGLIRTKKSYWSNSLRISEEALAQVRQFEIYSQSLNHSVWIFFFFCHHFFTLATSTALRCQPLTRFKVSIRYALSVLQRTSGNLGSWNISHNIAAIKHQNQLLQQVQESFLPGQVFWWSTHRSTFVHLAVDIYDKNTRWRSILLGLHKWHQNYIQYSILRGFLVGWLVGFYGISTFVGYLTPNPFLHK